MKRLLWGTVVALVCLRLSAALSIITDVPARELQCWRQKVNPGPMDTRMLASATVRVLSGGIRYIFIRF